MSTGLKKFFESESAGGIILVIVAILAMLVANSGLSTLYFDTLHTYFLGLSIHHWINDALMAVFFFSIGMEVKYELLSGSLNSKEKAVFPAFAAVGGMIAPAIIFTLFNSGDATAMRGWAIPTATDIAFALGVLSLLGNRVPTSLKAFLLALAIIDDLLAIIIIAAFYTSEISAIALLGAAFFTVVLFIMNKKFITNKWLYLVVGILLWYCVLKSGAHATLAGVIIGLAIPLQAKDGEKSLLKELEHGFAPYVNFFILPIFAFANAGIPLAGMSINSLFEPVPLGIMAGLLLGKPLGIIGFSYLSVKSGIAKLPEGVEIKHILSISVLCAIGFTMSIFISGLAFTGDSVELDKFARLGVLTVSTVSAILGYALLNMTLPKKDAK